MTEKMSLYKSRLSSLRKEMSDHEKNAQEQGGHGSRLAKSPEYYALQERVQMLEEEIVAERNSHSITKNMLRQESEHRKMLVTGDWGDQICLSMSLGAAQSGTTHVSTPFPVPGSSFRFSYCRGDQASLENETPSLTLGSRSMSERKVSWPTDATAKVENITSKEKHSLSPVDEGQQKREIDEGAMDVDDFDVSLRFATPGPTRPDKSHEDDTDPEMVCPRRATLVRHGSSIIAQLRHYWLCRIFTS